MPGDDLEAVDGAAAGDWIKDGLEGYLEVPAGMGDKIPAMTKAELIAQVQSMTEEEAAEVKLVYAPDWPSKATSIEEMRKRTGTTPMSPEAFGRHFGSLPTDGEG